MSVTVESTTDTKEAVLAATGSKLAQGESKDESKSESAIEEKSEVADESKEDSEASSENETESEGEGENDTPESDEKNEGDEDAEKDTKPKKNKGFKKRIGKLNQKLSEKENEVQYWKNEAQKQQISKPIEDAPKKLETLSNEGKPEANKFDTHDEYIEALVEWKSEQKEKAREAKQKETTTLSEFDSKKREYVKQVSDFAKSNPDFKEALEDVSDIMLNPGLQQLLFDAEDIPHLVHEIAKDPEVLKKLNSMDYGRASREIGKIEARIAKASESSSQETKQTKAPAPISPVSKGSGKSAKNPENMSFQEYKKWREQRA